MGATPIGLDDTTLSATSGRGTLEHGVPSIGESAIFGWFPTLVFERFHGADSVRVALRGGLCGFHLVLYGRQLPAQPTESPP